MKGLFQIEKRWAERFELFLMGVMFLLSFFSIGNVNLSTLPPTYVINVILDSYGMVVLFILYHSVMMDRRDINIYRNIFLALLFIQHIALFTDVYAWLLQGIPEFAALNKLDNTIFYLVGPLLTMAFYVYVRISTDYENSCVRYLDNFVSIVTMIGVLMTILNVYTGWYFKVDELGVYARTYPYTLLSFLFPILILVATEILIMLSSLKVKEKIVLSTYFLFPCVFVYIQLISFGLSIMYIATLLSTFIVYSQFYLHQSKVTVDNSYEIAKREAVIAETRNKLVMAQIRPEFIYTGMQTMRNLVDENPEVAITTLDNFMGYIVSAINNMGSEGKIPLEEELAFTHYYLECEQAKYGERFTYRMDEGTFAIDIPPLIIEPIMEVIINNGLALSDETNDKIIIQIWKELDKCQLIVEDYLANVNVENCTDDKMASVLERANSYGIKIKGGMKPSGGVKFVIEMEVRE